MSWLVCSGGYSPSSPALDSSKKDPKFPWKFSDGFAKPSVLFFYISVSISALPCYCSGWNFCQTSQVSTFPSLNHPSYKILSHGNTMKSIHSTIKSSLSKGHCSYTHIHFCGEREERKKEKTFIDPRTLLYLKEWLLNEIKQYLVLSFIYLAKKGMNSNTPHNEHIFIPWYQDADLLVNNFKWICFITTAFTLYCAWVYAEAIYFRLNPVNILK